jgi:hypothetical protein
MLDSVGLQNELLEVPFSSMRLRLLRLAMAYSLGFACRTLQHRLLNRFSFLLSSGGRLVGCTKQLARLGISVRSTAAAVYVEGGAPTGAHPET